VPAIGGSRSDSACNRRDNKAGSVSPHGTQEPCSAPSFLTFASDDETLRVAKRLGTLAEVGAVLRRAYDLSATSPKSRLWPSSIVERELRQAGRPVRSVRGACARLVAHVETSLPIVPLRLRKHRVPSEFSLSRPIPVAEFVIPRPNYSRGRQTDPCCGDWKRCRTRRLVRTATVRPRAPHCGRGDG
jgi:hypothetical protein